MHKTLIGDMDHPVSEQGKQEPLWFGCDSPWAGQWELPIVLSAPYAPFPGISFPLSCPKPHKFSGTSVFPWQPGQ